MKNKLNPTIIMPKKILKAWLDDLENGNARQGFGTLQNGGGGYCCLGRLQKIIDNKVERDNFGNIACTPSMEWLSQNNITFLNELNRETDVPYLPSLGMDAAEANDGDGELGQRNKKRPKNAKTFKEIAKAIRKTSKGT